MSREVSGQISAIPSNVPLEINRRDFIIIS